MGKQSAQDIDVLLYKPYMWKSSTVISFNLSNNSMKQILLFTFANEKAEVQGNLSWKTQQKSDGAKI